MTRPRKYRENHIDSATHIESLARAWTETAINTLAGIMAESKCSPKDRIRAAEILLDRGWGKAVEHHVLADLEGNAITKIVREIVHLEPMPQDALLVEYKDVSDDGEHVNGGAYG